MYFKEIYIFFSVIPTTTFKNIKYLCFTDYKCFTDSEILIGQLAEGLVAANSATDKVVLVPILGSVPQYCTAADVYFSAHHAQRFCLSCALLTGMLLDNG